MKNIALVLVFVLLHRTSNCWYAKEFRNASQDSEGCESVDVNIGKMQLGEFRNLEDCVQAVCGDNGILYLGCKEIELNCTVIDGNATMPYPQCCAECKEATKLVN